MPAKKIGSDRGPNYPKNELIVENPPPSSFCPYSIPAVQLDDKRVSVIETKI